MIIYLILIFTALHCIAPLDDAARMCTDIPSTEVDN